MLSLLDQSHSLYCSMSEEATQQLNSVFDNNRVSARATSCEIIGPLRKYEIHLSGAKLARLESPTFQKEIALALKASKPPVVFPRYEDGIVAMEFMFGSHPTIFFNDVRQKLPVRGSGALDVLLGTTNIYTPLIRDLTKMPHLLIAGTTGSGKSSLIHCLIKSLIEGISNKPPVQLCLLDAKMVEFNRYNDVRELLFDVGTSPKSCLNILRGVIEELLRRLALLAAKKFQNIADYHAAGFALPYLVVIIDELADLIRFKGVSEALGRVAAMGRAAGIHLIVSVYHPTHTVLEGAIKASFPCRIAMKVASPVHSRVVLDATGAENLLGNGDGLFLDGSQLLRFHGAYIDLEKEKIVRRNWLQKNFGF